VKYIEPTAPDEKDLPILPKEWCWATPKQLAATSKYSLAIGPFGSNLKVEDYQERGIPLVFVRNIRSTIFDGPDTRYVTVTKADELRAHRVIGGDILITKMGDPPGDACLYPGANSPAIITADCIKWTLSQLLAHRRFFVNAINSSIVRTQILGITQGVAQLKVSLGRFEGIALPLPPLTEQEQIVSEVERRLSVISQLEATIEANLKRAERLRQSILREAFAGRLVPQDPTDEPADVLLERIQSERNGQKNGDGMNNKKNRSIKVPEPVTLDVGEAEQTELWESVGN
jgi:type I restriction enzyme S subunit